MPVHIVTSNQKLTSNILIFTLQQISKARPNKRFSIHPIGNKNVGVTLHLGIAVRGKDQLPAVRREHREAVEGVVVCDALQSRPVYVDGVEIEVTPLCIVDVRSEDAALPVREEVGRETRRAQM